jgi:hypothetical protein
VSKKYIGTFISDGNAYNLILPGGVPDKIKVMNMNAAVTEVAILEWIYGMGDAQEIQYDRFLAGTSAGDFFLKLGSAGYISAYEPGTIVGSRKSVTFDDTGGAAVDLITCTEAAGHGYKNGDRVMFKASGGLPTNVTELLQFYVIDAAALTFRVSLTKDGAAFDFGSDGTPPNYVFSISDLDLGGKGSGAGITISGSFMDDGDVIYFEAEYADEYIDLGDVA